MTLTRAYRWSVLTVAMWGLLALFSTGEFGLPLVGVAGLLILMSQVLHSRGLLLPPMAANVLTIIVFAVLLDLSRSSLLDAAIYFFLFLLLIKLFTHRNTTDTLWVHTISFFLMVAAAVLTTSLAFAFVFLAYLLLMVLSLVLLTLMRTREQSAARHATLPAVAFRDLPVLESALPRTPSGAHPDAASARFTRGFLLFVPLLSVVILGVAVWFFMVIPRLSTQRLFQPTSQRPPTGESVSAFGENIEFGAVGRINMDPSVAMFVRPLDEARGSHVRLRGVALDTFDASRWRRTSRASTNERIPFDPFHRQSERYPLRRNLMIQPPGVTNFLFGDAFPVSIRMDLDQPLVYDPQSNAVWLPHTLGREFHYTVHSRSEELEMRRDPAEHFPVRAVDETRSLSRMLDDMRGSLRGDRRPLNPEERRLRAGRFTLDDTYRLRCLQMPETLDAERLRALAEDWTSDAGTPFGKARAIEQRLRLDYRYSLNLRPRGNFIESFLFDVPEGHCEYFATSMVMLLRSIGIPARIVNGFYSAEWNNIALAFTVRQRDAHSWVEVYFDNYGWMTFEPTPAEGIARPSNVPYLQQSLGRLADALKVRWYRYMIDYSFTDQMGIIRSVLTAAHRVRSFMDDIRVRDADSPWRLRGEGIDAGLMTRVVVIIAITTAGVGLVALLRGYRRPARRRRAKFVIGFYADVIRQLGRMGYELSPGETPREFACRVTGEHPELDEFRAVTEIYYNLRFRGRQPADDDWRRIRDLDRTVRTVRRGRARAETA